MIKETKITFFGMLFDAGGVYPDPEKVEAIKVIQEPRDTKELQSFLGTATYMAPYVPNLSAMSEPLRRNLLKKTRISTGPHPTVQLLRRSSSRFAERCHLPILILKRKQLSKLMPPFEVLGVC